MNFKKHTYLFTSLITLTILLILLIFFYIFKTNSFHTFFIYHNKFNFIFYLLIFLIITNILLIFIKRDANVQIIKYLLFIQIIFSIIFILNFNYIKEQINNIPNFSNIAKTTKPNNQKGEINLQITITDYPKTINNYCEPATITLKVKNISNKTLKYQDLIDKKYQFQLVSGNEAWPIWMKIGLGDLGQQYNSTIEDFKEIKPNEEKTLIIQSGSPQIFYYEDWPVFLNNIFANKMREVKKNIDYKYHIEFIKIEQQNKQIPIAKSNEIIVKGNIYENNNLKICPLATK